jgi:hypothetical protein
MLDAEIDDHGKEGRQHHDRGKDEQQHRGPTLRVWCATR